MIIPFTLLFGAIGYLYYKSKDEVSLLEEETLDFPNILDKFKKKKSDAGAFVRWFLIWYLGSSILLLLSLHSYYMDFGK